MKKDICCNLSRINDSKNLSLRLMSSLMKLNYESVKGKKRRNKLDERFCIKAYNLTLAQLEELKNEREYHHMVDYKYYWGIIHYVNRNVITKKTGLSQISSILHNADGKYSYDRKNLVFIPKYEISNYLKYSSSLIVINQNKKVKKNPDNAVVESINEEIEIINRIVNLVNKGFPKDVLKDIFVYRYIMCLETKEITKRLNNINLNKYYRLLSETNEISYRTFGLYTEKELKEKITCVSDM